MFRQQLWDLHVRLGGSLARGESGYTFTMTVSSDVHLRYRRLGRSRLLSDDRGHMYGRRGEGHGKESYCVIVGAIRSFPLRCKK